MKTFIICTLHFLGAFENLRKATVSFVILSVRLSTWNTSAPSGRTFIKFDVWGLLDKCSLSKKQQTHTQTDCNHIRLQTAQFYNERMSTDLNLVTCESTVHGPPEDGFKNGTETCRGKFLSVLNPLNAELNPICHLLALLRVHFLHTNVIYIWSTYSWCF